MGSESRVLPYDKINAELFYPDRDENKQTTGWVHKMAVEAAQCLLEELRDPKKATSDYLTSEKGQFSWGYTSDSEHAACLGKMATNDPAESPFAMLTNQMQSFGRILGIHASGVGQARMNGDFERDLSDGNRDGQFYQLSDEMRDSLITFALGEAPEMRKTTSAAVNRQRTHKLLKRQQLRNKKLIAAQREYANALTHIDVFHSPAGWKDEGEVRRGYALLGSKTARLEAVKNQIRIRTVGFGWMDLHHPWSKQGVDYSPEHLRDYLINTIIPEQAKRPIPKVPPAHLPSRGDRPQLGTQTKDVAKIDKKRKGEARAFRIAGKRMRDEMEASGEVADRNQRKQPPRPLVDENFVDEKVEQCWEYTEKNGTISGEWCKGIVVGVMKNNKVHIKWDEKSLRPGELKITTETFLISKWNRTVEFGWRMNLDVL